MATPAERNLALNGLTAAMRREFTRIWMRLDLTDPRVLRDPLAEVLQAIADKYGNAASALAAEFYDELRESVVKSGPRFTPVLAELPGLERFESLAGWGIGPLFGANPDPTMALSNLVGGLQYDVTNAYMGTIAGSSLADPAANGWQRVADAGACDFCRMLESRGSVYSAEGVLFGAHDHCGCSAEPDFKGAPLPVKPYTPSKRSISAADRARALKWIAAHPNG